MEFSIPVNIDESIPLVMLFERIAKHGFAKLALTTNPQHCDYEQQTGRLQLMAYAKEHGVVFDTLHVPVNQNFDITSKHAETRMGAVCNVANTMHAARVLGVRTVVISATHALPSRHGSDTKSLIHALEGLIESAEIMGINIALRNLIERLGLDSLAVALREYSSPRFGLCYDTALDVLADHEPYVLLEEFGDRLKAVIFADTDGKAKQNLVPLSGAVDWQKVCAMLSDHGYSEPVTLNVNLPAGAETGLRELAEVGRQINEMLVS
ncbi:MAG: TIM barrel protein [Candidatus Zixiibacteriota bacterium]